MNCKVLDSGQLKKLDKMEKSLAHEIHTTGKGKTQSSVRDTFVVVIFIQGELK